MTCSGGDRVPHLSEEGHTPLEDRFDNLLNIKGLSRGMPYAARRPSAFGEGGGPCWSS